MPSKSTKISSSRAEDLGKRLDKLERSLKRIEKKIENQPTPSPARRNGFASFMRQLTLVLLVLLCGLSVTLAAGSAWVKRTVTNTDVWVEKTSQLIQEPAIRSTISTTIADQIFEQADVETQIAQVLPERINGLAVPLTNSLRSAVNTKIDEALSSSQFTEAWAKANRSAHAGIIESLHNKGVVSDSIKQNAIMYVDSNRLVLNLKPVFADIRDRLVQNGLGFVGSINLSSINSEITLFTIQRMPTVLLLMNIIDKAAVFLVVAAMLCGAGAVALTRNRRRMLMAIGWTIAAYMVVLVQLVGLANYAFMGSLINTVAAAQTETALAAYEIMTNDLVIIARMFMAIALLMVIAGLLGGSSKPAVFIKTQLGKLMRLGDNQPAVVRWVRRNTGTTFAGIATVAALLIVFPLVRNNAIYPIVVVGIATLASLLVATITQSTADKR